MRYETIEKNGQPFVVLSLKDFKKLQEDAEMIDDIKAFDEARTEGGENFPAEVVYAILEGQNPVKVYREYRNLTQEALAKAAHISRAYLAQIETAKKTGTIATLKSIAEALKVDLDDIV